MLESSSTLGVAKQSQQRSLRVSRIMQESDLSIMKLNQGSLVVRPRGVVSGYLVVTEFSSVYVPFKGRPEQIRLRLSDDVRKGTIFMAQRTTQGLVLEDVMVWKGDLVWLHKTFPDRWSLLRQFFATHVVLDPVLQRLSVKPVSFSTAPPAFDVKSVLEWIPHGAGQRRLLFVPNGEPTVTPVSTVATVTIPTNTMTYAPNKVEESELLDEIAVEPVTEVTVEPPVSSKIILAKRDISGPDVFQLWRGTEALGMALIRTMAVSKAMRLHKGEDIPVEAIFNGKFKKWEIMSVRS